MIAGAKYRHTNLVALDWRSLARFYAQVFGCELAPPERDLAGAAFERGTAIAGARAWGVHLRLPGGGEDGPTLEIFQYEPPALHAPSAVNQPGFAHIAFQVDSVASAQAEVIAAGGAAVGEVVTTTIATGEEITWCYVRDPEGNIIELQSTRETSG
ncbi:MAG: VOC family protein [Caulobacterales bacterium]